MSKNFLESGECLIELPDSECGALNGQVLYSPPDYQCKVCGMVLDVETDIDGDTDSDFQPGEKDGTDGENEDDGESDSGAPVDALVKEDTPEEAMFRNTQKQLQGIIQELNEGAGDTDVFTSFFINNFDSIVSYYMLFTKYGPFTVIDRPSSKKEVVLEVACSYMMMEENMVRFKVLAIVTGYSEPGLINAALRFIQVYKGEEYQEGAYLIEIYAPALGLPGNFVKPMKDTWLALAHPRGTIRDKVIAFILAYARRSTVNLTQQQVASATGISRASLSPQFRQSTKLLEDYLQAGQP